MSAQHTPGRRAPWEDRRDLVALLHECEGQIVDGPYSDDLRRRIAEAVGGVPAFIEIRPGELFRIPFQKTIYRKLTGVAFECVEPHPDRAMGFKAFDAVFRVRS